MVQHKPPARTQLSGDRRFTWYTPAGKNPTEYEDLTVDQQSTPEHFAFQGWPIRFDDGRDPYFAESTVIRSVDWYAFRDPNATIQREYIAEIKASEQALERSVMGARAAGLFSFANDDWVRTGLNKNLMTYPFIDYGMFLAQCYAEREALSDTITFAIVFAAADKLRHLQDVVYYSFDLAEVFPDFDDSESLTIWKTDPMWQGARSGIEQVIASNDWMEVVVAIHLCIEPIFGQLAKVEYFSRFAAANGDIVTPIMISSFEADGVRHQRWVNALIEHVLNDPEHGDNNHEIIAGWIAKWTAIADEAASDFAPAFTSAPICPTTFEEAFERVHAALDVTLDWLNLPSRQYANSAKGSQRVSA